MAEYIVPTDARAEFRRTIQRANRRILANLDYIKNEGIRDNAIKTSLAGDFTRKKAWATAKSPLSTSTRFKSELEYKQFMRFINRWGEDTGRRGGFSADPRERLKKGKEAIYKAIYGLQVNKGVSLEEWGGRLPKEVEEAVESMSLEQMSRFFDNIDVDGLDTVFDSDQVAEEDDKDFLSYVYSHINEVKKFYPRPEKRVTKRKKKKRTRRKTKGRK